MAAACLLALKYTCAALPPLLLVAGRQRVEVQLDAVVEGGLQLSSVPVRYAGMAVRA